MEYNRKKVFLSENVYLDLDTYNLCYTFDGKIKEEPVNPKMYKTLLRITQSDKPQRNKVYLTENVYIDFSDHQICSEKGGIEPVRLTKIMYNVLAYLCERSVARSQDEIYNNAWEFSEKMGGAEQVRAVITLIRAALKQVDPGIDPAAVIKTYYGVGYKLNTLHSHEEYTPDQILSMYIKALKKDYQRRYDESFAIYSKLAEQKHAPSINRVGIAYMKGQGIAKDEKKGFSYYLDAAHRGLSTAQLNVGDCYMEGRGISKDPEKAVTYYLLAARNPEDPDEDAMFRLFECYLNGIGVDQDMSKSRYWHQLALSHGRHEHRDFYEIPNEGNISYN